MNESIFTSGIGMLSEAISLHAVHASRFCYELYLLEFCRLLLSCMNVFPFYIVMCVCKNLVLFDLALLIDHSTSS